MKEIIDENGRVCPKCGERKTRVYAEGVEDGILFRRRLCPACGNKWRTIELEFWKGLEAIKNG